MAVDGSSKDFIFQSFLRMYPNWMHNQIKLGTYWDRPRCLDRLLTETVPDV